MINNDYTKINALEGLCNPGDIVIARKDFKLAISPILSNTLQHIAKGTIMMYLGTCLKEVDRSYVQWDLSIYFLHDEKVMYDGFLMNNQDNLLSRLESLKNLWEEEFRNLSNPGSH